jgi:tRNA nucleotidyltransferase (CCA-adding enzyme)
MTTEGEAAPAFAAEEVSAQLVRAGEVADRREVGLWFVGGALRDLLLGRPLHDVDLAVEAAAANALELATRLGALPGWTLERSHVRFGTARLRAPGGLRVDVAATRREEYPAPASLPVVTGTTTIEEDLGRRDFTINAMARRVGKRGLTGSVLDPFGGRRDLASKTLRLLHPKSLVDDPTRAYRAVKYALRLGFEWDGEFEKALKRARAAGAFGALSGDRMRRGFEEIFLEGQWEQAERLIALLELLCDVLPGWAVPHSPSKKKTKSAAALTPLDAPRPEPERPKAEISWKRLLAPLTVVERAAVESRLNFSRALRRAAEAEVR